MSCLLTMCLGKLFMPKFNFLEDEEDDTATPSLYENVKNDIAFKVKVAKKERELKAEMAERNRARQKRRDKLKLKPMAVATK